MKREMRNSFEKVVKAQTRVSPFTRSTAAHGKRSDKGASITRPR